MQPPDVQFATTSDDVTIAYWSIGTGQPLIITQNFSLSHAEAEWKVPSFASWYQALAQHHRVIRFDPRHAGMSEASLALDTTLDGMGHDITAVADACSEDEFALFAVATMGPLAIEYTAANPERVSHLILCDTYPTVAGSSHSRWIEAQGALARIRGSNDLAARLYEEVVPRREVDEVVALAVAAQGSDLDQLSDQVLKWDASDRLEYVQAPTLVLAARDSRISRLDDARVLATGIPSAQLKGVSGGIPPWYADRQEILSLVASFLGTGVGESDASTEGFTTVVFTDLVESTEVMSRLGDAEGRKAFRGVEETTARIATEHRGEVIKYTGDGSLVAFPSASSGLSFAVAMLEAMTESSMELRIGMAAGEPIREGGDLHGAVVHQASRVADQAVGGEIVVADSVRQLALGKGFAFEPAGEKTLKGFDEPVRLWRATEAS